MGGHRKQFRAWMWKGFSCGRGFHVEGVFMWKPPLSYNYNIFWVEKTALLSSTGTEQFCCSTLLRLALLLYNAASRHRSHLQLTWTLDGCTEWVRSILGYVSENVSDQLDQKCHYTPWNDTYSEISATLDLCMYYCACKEHADMYV